jgi:acyl-CoA synthetase (AMP-forming)/AMP-acid ligase II
VSRHLAPTWDHAAGDAYPGLRDQPSIEALFEEVGLRPEVRDRVVLVDGDVRITGRELLDRVRRLAGGLGARGVRPGDAVCFQVPSWWETTCLYRACWRLGAVAVPVHHQAGEADVARAVADVEPIVLLSDPDRPLADHPDTLQVRGDGGFEELFEARPVEEVAAHPADLAVVLFTSGSTGGPKGVLHTHRALAYKARSLLGIHGIDHRDTVLMPAPMAHISGLSNAVMLPGAGGLTSVLMSKWSPEEAVELVRREGVTFMMGPPTFFQTMLRAANFSDEAVATMRLISCGGAGVTPAFVEAASAGFGAIVKRTYGSTEAPVVTTWHAGDDPARTGDSDGRAAGEIELRVTDPSDGREVEPGAGDGELWLRGPELFVGYTDPARNDAAIGIAPDGGRWFRTGDLATLDVGADGHAWLRIVGRIKDIIIRGGENISAAELEGVLEAHPAVHQAVAVGYPDERLGERVCAFVVCHEPGQSDADFDLDECRRWFEAAGVTRFKWPERVVHLDHLPVLASSGKADRAELRTLAAGLPGVSPTSQD